MRTKISELKGFVTKYERHLSSLALGAGFIIDSITLKRIDLPFENLILLAYVLLAGLAIVVLNFLEARQSKNLYAERLRLITPFVIQFAFGGLFSGFTVFYSRSGSFASSWPFILILVGLLVGNELLKRQYQRLVFQITVFFVTLFFFSIFAVPVITGKMGVGIFILSGILSLILVAGFVYLVSLVIPERIRAAKHLILYTVGSVYVLIHLLYFANIIPPIPLSLKHAGVYHSLKRSGDDYLVSSEKWKWKNMIQIFDTIHARPDETLYAFSAVFAPTKIETEIFHHWQRFDTEKRRWITVSRISYPIRGGRAEGYRWYSYNSHLAEGKWRVDVETARGQVVGRITFSIVHQPELPELEDQVI